MFCVLLIFKHALGKSYEIDGCIVLIFLEKVEEFKKNIY